MKKRKRRAKPRINGATTNGLPRELRPRETHEPDDAEIQNETEEAEETQEPEGNRETHEAHDTDEFRTFSVVRTLKDAAMMALSIESGGDIVFRFARALLAFQLTTRTRLSANDRKPAFNVFWSVGKDRLPTDADYDEYFFCFLDAFEKAKSPLGANALEAAKECMPKTPVPAEAKRFQSPKIQKLVHLCWALQRIQGDAPFFLSSRDAGAVIGCDHKHALKLLNGLLREKILTLVTKGRPEGRRATRFRYASVSTLI